MTTLSTPADLTDRPAPTRPGETGPPLRPEQELVIRARSGWIAVDFAELWRNRELLFFLVWRDVKVRYKQAILGFAWAIFVPLLSMLIFTAVGKLIGLDGRVPTAPGAAAPPYALYIYAGLIPWLFLTAAMSGGGMSLVNQQHLLSKIYLPRLYIPTASVGSAMVDMAISMGMLGLLMAFYRFAPPLSVLAVLPLTLLALLAALGLAYSLSALTIMYRDLRFLIPFFVQIGAWLTAVFYPPAVFGKHQWLLLLNPLAAIVEGYRSALLGLPFPWLGLGLSVVMCTGLFVFGLYYFRKAERRFADIA